MNKNTLKNLRLMTVECSEEQQNDIHLCIKKLLLSIIN